MRVSCISATVLLGALACSGQGEQVHGDGGSPCACRTREECNPAETCALQGECGTCLPDPDHDGVPNLAPASCASSPGSTCDNCPEVANADQADADQDHLGDACDSAPKTANYTLHRGTIAPGGGLTVGKAHDLTGTAGQPTAGAGELRSDRYRLRAGFAGAASPP